MATEAAQLEAKEPTEVKTVLTLTGLLMEGVDPLLTGSITCDKAS
jgi:hypothetical protein